MTGDRLTLRRPDDWHVHFRDGAALAHTVPPIASVFGRVVAMPNLRPPVRTTAEALAYRDRLQAASPTPFTPLPSLYLSDDTTPDELARAKAAGLVAVKLYPAHATTNAEAGVTDVLALGHVFSAMSELGLVLQLHGEATDPDCDIFDREARFLDTTLAPLCERHPDLRVILEHATTARAIAFVRAAGTKVAATLTPHHLEIERSSLFSGGLRPHLYCLPIAKTRADREALLDAALSSHPRFFLGSDSAPHPRRSKESACCPAGVYCGHATLSHYAEVFDRHGALDRLEAFASHHGADFYGLPRNDDTVTLLRAPWPVPATLPFGPDEVVPYRAGDTLTWRVLEA